MAGLLDALVGSSDPSTADPTTGLLDSQRKQLAYNALGQTGALLLAAGAPQMPGQNAQYLAALGNVAGNTQQQGLQMQQGNAINQRTIAEKRKNDETAALLQYTQTPEFQKAFDGLPPAAKAVAQAQLKMGDVSGLLKTVQESRVETTPKFNPDGSFYLPATGEYVDPVRGIRMKVDQIGHAG